MLDAVSALTERDDALDAELVGTTVLAAVLDEGGLVPTFISEVIAQVESRSGPGALALLLTIVSAASGTQGPIAKAAAAAAARLSAAGVPKPVWAADLATPPQTIDLVRLRDHAGMLSVLVGSFERAGHAHAFIVTVDHHACGAAAEIFFMDADQLPEVLDHLRENGQVVTTGKIDPAEFRWYVEDALAARAVHDEEGPLDTAPFEEYTDDENEGPPYPVLAALVRTRLAALPQPRKPVDARPHHEDSPHMTLAGQPPAEPKNSNGPAPIYQIKIGLRDAKPPIWRRLLVPADTSLARLHEVIQLAFGWDDSHLHVFETPYGDFGQADRELGHRAEKSVTLEQVAPQVKDKVRYIYDFGDAWSHEILVEKVLDRDPALTYPRCVGGRRAAPPDDCGGMWGYEHLVEVLGNPAHPDHKDRLEWLGWEDASHFDPAAFDPEDVNAALAKRGER